MSERQKEVLIFLNKDHKPFRTRGGWYNDFKNKNKNSSEFVHWGSIGKFLENESINMIDSNGNIYDFTQDIIEHDKTDKQWKNAREKEWDWLPRQQIAFHMLGKTDDRETYNEHVCGIIGLLKNFGYKFKAKDETTDQASIGTNTRIPTKEELREIALNLRKINKEIEPQFSQIINEWQTIYKINLNNNQREELKFKYFTKK